MHDHQDRYLTVATEGVHETEVHRSRFRCLLAPATTEEVAQATIARVRQRYPTASHHCWAYVIGADAEVQKTSDDGEPGGTAGAPMLRMLSGRDVRCVVAVVSRWFGGTKLGAGGLIRAYGGAVGRALDTLGTVTRLRFRHAWVVIGHERAGRVENDLRVHGYTVHAVHYGAQVAIELSLPEAELDGFRSWLAETSAGTARLALGEEAYGTSGDG